MFNTLAFLAASTVGQLFVVNPYIQPVVVQQPQPIVVPYVIQQPQYIVIQRPVYVPVYQPVYQSAYYPYPIYRIYP
jgi:hypothetical protein